MNEDEMNGLLVTLRKQLAEADRMCENNAFVAGEYQRERDEARAILATPSHAHVDGAHLLQPSPECPLCLAAIREAGEPRRVELALAAVEFRRRQVASLSKMLSELLDCYELGQTNPEEVGARARMLADETIDSRPKSSVTPFIPCGVRRREGQCVLAFGHEGEHATDYGWRWS